MSDNDMNHNNPYAPPALIAGKNIKTRRSGKGLGVYSLFLGIAAITILVLSLIGVIYPFHAVLFTIIFVVLGIALGKNALKSDEYIYAIVGILLNVATFVFLLWLFHYHTD